MGWVVLIVLERIHVSGTPTYQVLDTVLGTKLIKSYTFLTTTLQINSIIVLPVGQ